MGKKKTELHSLNEGLTILYAEELEQRMETDPLPISGLLGGEPESPKDLQGLCIIKVTCGELSIQK